MVSFLHDYVNRSPQSAPSSIRDLKTREAGGFLLGWRGGGLPCQALRHLPDRKILLRWIFEDGSEEAVRRRYVPILESFRPNRGRWQEYALFGLDIRLPADYDLEEMNTLPANVRLLFESDKRARATFRRWGMPEIVLGGSSMEDFYPYFLQHQGCRAVQVCADRVAGMNAVRGTYTQRPQHRMERLMGRSWTGGKCLLWFDEREQRLYSIEQIGPPGVPLPEEGELCAALGTGGA